MTRRPLLALAAALSIAACATPPGAGPAAAAGPVSRSAACAGFAAARGEPPQEQWWRAYGDPQLDGLIEEALASPPTLAAVAARLRAGRGAEGADDSASAFAAELDLWDRNRPRLASATSRAEAARLEGAEACILLTTSLVSAYGELWLAGADHQAAANRLAVLAAASPDRVLTLQAPAGERARFGLPENVIGQLIGRRPDLLTARWRIAAAERRIGIAQTGRSFGLSSSLRFRAFGLNNLIRSGSDTGQAGLGFWGPIFEGSGGQLDLARRERDAAEVAYGRALSDALGDAAVAVAEEQGLERELTEARAGLAREEAAYQATRQRAQQGAASARDLQAAEEAIAARRRTLGRLRAKGFITDAALVRAIGGGFILSP
ncbi:TolC family protein [Phenylobacterium sp.]|uniref:TolC family protein n=1 Tax=Phenylobacterium sp. TaxID=1871053 RepID=UPI003562738F